MDRDALDARSDALFDLAADLSRADAERILRDSAAAGAKARDGWMRGNSDGNDVAPDDSATLDLLADCFRTGTGCGFRESDPRENLEEIRALIRSTGRKVDPS